MTGGVRPRRGLEGIGTALLLVSGIISLNERLSGNKKRLEPDIGVHKYMQKEDYDYSNWRDDFQATEYESVDLISNEPLQPTEGLGSDMLGEAKSKGEKLKEISKQLAGA